MLQAHGRLLMSFLAGGLGILVTRPLPGELQAIICFDLAAIAYLGLFLVLMNVATPEQAAECHIARNRAVHACWSASSCCRSLASRQSQPCTIRTTTRAGRMRQLASSLLAICVAWLLAHNMFGLYYMYMYYRDTTPNDAEPYDQGMAYPERKMPDYWDFM